MRYVIPTTVVSVNRKDKTLRTYVGNDGKTIIELQDLGWFVLFDGSYESLFVGREKPEDLLPGTKVKIIIEIY